MIRSYTGSCHCKAIRFRFRSEEIVKGCRCNCSICIRKGAVMSLEYILPENIDDLVGLERLTVYRWGEHTVSFYFCPTCGIAPFHDTPLKPGRRINLGCVEELDALALEIEIIDGRSW